MPNSVQISPLPTQNVPPEPQPLLTSKVKIGIALSVVVIIVGVIAVFQMSQGTQKAVEVTSEGIKNTLVSNPSPTPFPFEELTIPFLRQKKYDGQLGELKNYANNGSFTSYLTSYTSDGLKINGLLTKPTGQMPEGGWPAIVFVHGYIPPNQYQTTEKYVDYVNFLARNGYVVFKIDLRGHGNSEGEPGGGYYSSDYISDTLNAYNALQKSDFVNPQKIGLWGHSMAGNVVFRSVAAKPDIPVAVIWGGAGFTYLDLLEYRITDASYRPQPTDSERQRKRARLREIYGDADPNNWFWKLVIPTNYLKDIKTAIQLDHAIDDNTVNVEYSRNLNKILDETSIPHEYHEYPNGDHNITNPSFTLAMQNTVNFFNKYLK